jgi:biopolymer transport protein ExbB/TolQ
MWGELAHSLQHANGYVMAILAFGFIATVVFFERLIMLQFVYHVDFPKFLANLKKLVAAEDLDRAIALCKNVSHTSLPRITQRALEAAETDPTTVRGTIEEEAIDFLPNLEKRLGVLPAVTLLIMLCGILGTIDALWGAFHSVDVLDTAKKQATLAQGIANALNPTALGLLFGMGLLAGYYLLRGMAVNLADRVHHGITVLTNLLVPQEMMA